MEPKITQNVYVLYVSIDSSVRKVCVRKYRPILTKQFGGLK